MLLERTLKVFLAATTILVAGCASQSELREQRRPPLPPMAVVKATPGGPYYHNISIEEVYGAPEFRLFDGGGLITTRPTHKDVLEVYEDDLNRADLLASDRLSSEYMLYVKFESLRGPNVWIFTDKQASARIMFHLVRWRTGDVVKSEQVEIAYDSKFPGLTPREAVASSVGLASGLATAYTVTRQVTKEHDVNAFTADIIGGLAGAHVGYDTGKLALLVLNTGGVGRYEPTPLSKSSDLGAFNGTVRRADAVRSMLDIALDEFLNEVSKDGSIQYMKAVSCSSINPYGTRESFVANMGDAYGIDCPGAKFFASRLFQAYPKNF
jgi:hypothetical protein